MFDPEDTSEKLPLNNGEMDDQPCDSWVHRIFGQSTIDETHIAGGLPKTTAEKWQPKDPKMKSDDSPFSIPRIQKDPFTVKDIQL